MHAEIRKTLLHVADTLIEGGNTAETPLKMIAAVTVIKTLGPDRGLLKICAPRLVGRLCNHRQGAKAEELIAKSVKQGVKLITGGHALDRSGFYFPPTILDCGSAPNAVSLSNGFFGPVLPVVSFKDEAVTVVIANDTQFGLASGMFTRDLSRAHHMNRAIQAGIVRVKTNRAVSPIAPFGEHGLSGHG